MELLNYLEPDMYQLYVEGNENDETALQSISLIDDLGFNILDIVDLNNDIRGIFNITIGTEITKCESIGELISLVVKEVEKDAVR